jgi:hypothetical protein
VTERATAGRARPEVPGPTGPPDTMRTVVGRRGLPCPERARPRSGGLAGRSGGSCRAGGDDPPGDEPAEDDPAGDDPAEDDPAPPTRAPAPESPLLKLLPRRPDAPASDPEAPASDPEGGPSRPGSPPERHRPQSAASPHASGPPRGSSEPHPGAMPAMIQASTMALRPAPPGAGRAAPSSAGRSMRRKQRPPATPTGRRPQGTPPARCPACAPSQRPGQPAAGGCSHGPGRPAERGPGRLLTRARPAPAERGPGRLSAARGCPVQPGW